MEAAEQAITVAAADIVATEVTGLVKVGDTTPPPSTDPVDASGGLLSSSGTVENVQEFVDTATKAPTFTTTTTVVTTTKLTTTQRDQGTQKPTTTQKQTTQKQTTQAPPVKYVGSVTITATGLSEAQLKTAMTKTLAKQFEVPESAVLVTATKARRLGESVAARRLTDNWNVGFTIEAAASKASAIQSKATALESDASALKTELSTQLKAIPGIDAAAADSLTVSSFTAKEDSDSTTTQHASNSHRAIGLIALITILGWAGTF
jgi:hypothetical protein